MWCTYRVEFETDPESREIIVSIPTLNYTADSGSTVEDALDGLRGLAQGFLEVLADHGEEIPPSDPPGEGLFLSLNLAPASVPA